MPTRQRIKLSERFASHKVVAVVISLLASNFDMCFAVLRLPGSVQEILREQLPLFVEVVPRSL
jgi:hypothetical protein